MPEPLEVVAGTLDVLVLKALSWAPMHGFEVTQWLAEHSGRSLNVRDSALYQAMYRLEERGLVKAEWGVTENNRRARYYRLTPAGRAALRQETETLLRYTRTLAGILTAVPKAAG